MTVSRLPASIAGRLRVPLVAAPMLRVSGLDLVLATCRAGAIGAFPTVNARDTPTLERWLDTMAQASAGGAAPHCANLIMRHARLRDHLACVIEHRVELVITSVGSPAPILPALKDAGATVFADVATLAHARKSLAAGADGLVLLTAGAGGQTGWLNPFAFVRAVREFFDGPILLAGGMSDGTALRAALALGADLGYMGTRFIAASESLAQPGYRDMLVDATMDDVMLSRAFTGLPTSVLRPAIAAAGLDPDNLDEQVTPELAAAIYGGNSTGTGPKRWTDVWSAGHSVSGVPRVQSAGEIVDEVAREFAAPASTPELV